MSKWWKRLGLVLGCLVSLQLIWALTSATYLWAQSNPQCSTRPVSSNDNSCASTHWVNLFIAQTGIIPGTSVSFIQSGTGAVTRTMQDKARDWLNAKDFGVLCDGSTNDVANINKAIVQANFLASSTTGSIGVRLPTGVCIVGSTSIFPLSNTKLVGAGIGATTLKVTGAFTSAGIIDTAGGGPLSNFEVSDLTIDMGDFTTTGTIGIQLATATNIAIRRNEIKKMGQFGISLGNVDGFWIEDNILTRTATATSQNQAIIVAASGVNSHGHINRNKATNSAFAISAYDTEITGNSITGFGFGSGITTEQNANCYNLTISGNVITGGAGEDVNLTWDIGIENWCKRSIISGNVLYSNAGDGIDNGGQDSIIANNLVYDNGTGTTGLNGINARYGDATYNSNNSIYSNNKSFNTTGASGTQTYGYYEQSSSLSGIVVTENNFGTNKTGPTNIASSSTTGSNVAQSFTPTLAFGGGSTGITYSIRTGSYVKIGRQVTAQWRIQLSAKGASTGAATISGFPGGGAGGNAAVSAGNCGYANNFAFGAGGHISGYIDTNFNLTYDNAGTTNVTDANFNNNTDMICSVSYVTAN